MIYLDTIALGPKSFISAWLKYKLPKFITKEQETLISSLSNWLIEPCLNFVQNKSDQFVFCSKMHLTLSFLKLFECMLDEMRSVIFYLYEILN